MKTRVLHYYNIMNRGGAETFIMNVFRNINRNNIEFNFLCSCNEKGAYDDEILSLGGKIFHISKPNNKHPIKAYKELLDFFHSEGPFDVIHLPVSFYSGFLAFVARKAGIKKIIVHSHISKIKKTINPFRNFYIFLMRILINKYSDVKIACGIEAGKLLFGKIDDVIIMNNGIDVDSYSFNDTDLSFLKKEFNISNQFIIGNVSRFFPVKNHEFFIQLGRFLKSKSINAKIILVGDGELREHIFNEVKEYCLEDYICFAGVRSNIRDFIKLFDVFVLPSFNEGFPVSIVEALAGGTPCVLSDGIPKETALIDDFVSFLPLSLDCSIWYEEMIRISKNKNKYDLKNINSILKNKGFDSYHIAELLEKIYRK